MRRTWVSSAVVYLCLRFLMGWASGDVLLVNGTD